MRRKWSGPEAPEVLEAILARFRSMTREEWEAELAWTPEGVPETRRTAQVPEKEAVIGRYPMHTFTVEVTLPDELRERFDARVQEHGGDHARYIREVLERDLTGGLPHQEMTFREIFAPSQEGFAATGLSDEELAEAVEAEVKAYRAARREREPLGE